MFIIYRNFSIRNQDLFRLLIRLNYIHFCNEKISMIFAENTGFILKVITVLVGLMDSLFAAYEGSTVE